MKRKAQDTELCGYFAMTLFAGIRPDEAARLSWDHVNAETKEITVPHDISKTKRTRLFTISDNLHQWLEHCRSRNTPLIPINLKNRKQAFVKTLSFAWVQDGLRHTFCTFHYAKHRNIEELRHIMGNSPAVIDRFYKGAIGKVEVEKFWDLRPETETPAGTKK